MFGLIPWRKERRAPAVVEGHPLARLRNEFGPLVERFFGDMLPFDPLPGMEWFGGVETEEKETEILLKMALPGFELAELEIFVNAPYLIIKAEHKVEPKEKEKEASYRTFRETLTLPPEVEPEKIEAFYRNGMLEIHLPKAEAPKGKKVEVKG
jgi:HSP20 family protein